MRCISVTERKSRNEILQQQKKVSERVPFWVKSSAKETIGRELSSTAIQLEFGKKKKLRRRQKCRSISVEKKPSIRSELSVALARNGTQKRYRANCLARVCFGAKLILACSDKSNVDVHTCVSLAQVYTRERVRSSVICWLSLDISVLYSSYLKNSRASPGWRLYHSSNER